MHATFAPVEKSATPLRRILRLCTLDGIFAMPIAVLGVPGNSIVAALLTGTFALSTPTYGLIASLPFWFNFLQVLLTPLLTQRLHPRSVTLVSSWLGLTGWVSVLIAFSLVPPGENGVTRAAFLLTFSLVAFSAAINGVTWNAWMQEAVPVRLRGKYFGRRNRLLYTSMLAFMLAASALLAWFDGGLVAFQLLFGGAIALRVVSIVSQHRMHTSATGRAPRGEAHWREQLRIVRAHTPLVRFIAFTALMGFAVNLFAPFYPVFLYEELQLSFARANFILMLGPLGAAISFPAWGRLLDRYGNVPIMTVALVLWQVFNFLWCFLVPDRLWLLYVVQVTGGLFSAGYGIGVFGLLLKLTPAGARTMGMALFVSISSITAALGPITGGYLLAWARGRGYPALETYHIAFIFMPVLTITCLLLLRKVHEPNSARLTHVVDAMRNVRTAASLFGLSFLVNQVFTRTADRRSR